MKVLVIEDDPLLSEFVSKCLHASGFIVEVVADGAKGYRKAIKDGYDCLVLDIHLPSMLGTEICKQLRAKGVVMPILFLSSNHTMSDRVNGLEIGADDYLVKPFGYEELVARVQALTRRPRTFRESCITYADLTIDTAKRKVRVKNKIIKLTPKEFQLLELLARNSETVLSREYLLNHIWGVTLGNTSNRLEVCIRGLRKKLHKYSSELISTEYGVGYKLSQEND